MAVKNNNPKEFAKLSEIADWRKKLDNDYPSEYELDGHNWYSVEHYINAAKQSIGRKPNASYSTTKLGRSEFKKHIEALEAIINKH